MPASPTSRLVAIALPLAFVVYAVVAATLLERRLSAAASMLVAVLLWRRHRRARFSAYIFLSAIALRSVLTHVWPLAAFAAVVVAVLQLPVARRAWPRVTSLRGNGDRMTAP